MNQPLIANKGGDSMSGMSSLAIIPRYNIFIQNYNKPTCIVDNIALSLLPVSTIHDNIFQAITSWKGKIILIILLCVPVFDIGICLILGYSLYFYFQCLNIHQKNQSLVIDPFKNMVYDHNLCYKLHKDYYSFTIQFKQLDGFSLNYNKNVRKQLAFRQQRGKANFLIYNGIFWSSYHHFNKYKLQHVGSFLASIAITTFVNIILFMLIL